MEEINKSEICKRVKSKMLKIGSHIKCLRKEHNLTQQDLAFYIFSDKSLISELERGNAKNITVSTLMKISDVFNIAVDDLFNG